MIFLCNITAYFSYDYFSFLLKISAEYDNIIKGNYNCRGIVMKIAVCDDEQPFRKQIIKSLEEYFDSMNMEFHVNDIEKLKEYVQELSCPIIIHRMKSKSYPVYLLK